MFCSSCGAPLEANAKFCSSCGAPATNVSAPASSPAAPASTPAASAPASKPATPVAASPVSQPAPAFTTSQANAQTKGTEPSAAAMSGTASSIRTILMTGKNFEHISMATLLGGFGIIIAAIAWIAVIAPYHPEGLSLPTIIATVLFVAGIAIAVAGGIGRIAAFAINR